VVGRIASGKRYRLVSRHRRIIGEKEGCVY
jgi:hypothetical protein